MKDLHKLINSIKSIHNPTCMASITQFNPDDWVKQYVTLPFTQKTNYDNTIIFENHQLKVDFNIFYGGLSVINEIKEWDCIIKPLSGEMYYYTFVGDEIHNKTIIAENMSNVILKEYDSESYLFENNEHFPVYALNFYDKKPLQLEDK